MFCQRRFEVQMQAQMTSCKSLPGNHSPHSQRICAAYLLSSQTEKAPPHHHPKRQVFKLIESFMAYEEYEAAGNPA